MLRSAPILAPLLAACITAAAPAHPGHGIVVDSKGAIHFVDTANESIWTITPDGRLRQTEVRRHMHRLVIDDADTLYFDHVEFLGPPVTVGDPPRLEPAGTRVASYWALDAAGTLTPVLPPTPTSWHTDTHPVLDEFGNGLTLLRDADGASYGVVYADGDPYPALVRREPATLAGQVTVIAPRLYEVRGGEERPVDFGLFQAFTWGADGSILTTERGTVRRITRDGRVTPVGGAPLRRDPIIGTTPIWQDSILGVTEDAAGNVYAADYGQGAVRRIDPADDVVAVHRSSLGWRPTGVAIAGEDLLILEHRVDILSPVLGLLGIRGGLGGPRVLRRAPDGTITVLATVNPHRIQYLVTAVVTVVLVLAFVIWRRARRKGPTRAIDLLEADHA